MRALCRELHLVGGVHKLPVHTIYFGGGTPSLVPVHEIETVLRTCASVFSLTPDVEITLEANPGTVDRHYLHALRQTGVNRLSIGMQSAHVDELKLFARRHRPDDVQTAVTTARTAGFDNISLDLIYGIPNQTMDRWQTSLETALNLSPDHLSLYSLGIEDDTPMQQWIANGTLTLPDPDQAADMYEWATDRLATAGFEQYEISNWAKPGFVCRHNIHYWRNLPYLGFGAGAHGYAAGLRYANVDHPITYIERIQPQAEGLTFPLSAAVDIIEPIDEQHVLAETMMMGLRLTGEGITRAALQTRFGCDPWEIYEPQIERLIACGLLEYTADAHLRLTRRGRLLGNHVFAEFV